jgi:hypothetical protein
MAKNIHQVVLEELSLYSQRQQKDISEEFLKKYPGRFSTANLLEFLKQKLEIEEYWEREMWFKYTR